MRASSMAHVSSSSLQEADTHVSSSSREFYGARVGEMRATSCVPYLKKGGCPASLDKELRLSSE
jgi:hypothetical protein